MIQKILMEMNNYIFKFLIFYLQNNKKNMKDNNWIQLTIQPLNHVIKRKKKFNEEQKKQQSNTALL